MKKRDRDSSIDRMLRQAYRTPDGAASDGRCIDAQTMAAWADGALSAREREAAEAHAADCVRCQALVAAMAKMAPPAAAEPWWRGRIMGWAMPLAAATAAIIVWTMVPWRARFETSSRVAVAEAPQTVARAADQPPPVAEPETQEKDTSTPPSAKTVTRDTAVAPSPSANATSSSRRAFAEPRRDESFAKIQPKREAAPVSAGASAGVPSHVDAQGGAAAVAETVRPAPPPPAAPAPMPAPPQTPVPAPASAAGSAGRPASAPVPASPAAAAEASAQRSAAAASQPFGSRSLAMSVPATTARQQEFVTVNGVVRWRLGAGGAVQRSIDGGTTWESQQTGTTETLTAGASPSPLVCWLVGPQGIVLLSTDGRTWRRVAFPETVNLVSVAATDDKRAAVTALDGRVFSTTDGGVTWTTSRE